MTNTTQTVSGSNGATLTASDYCNRGMWLDEYADFRGVSESDAAFKGLRRNQFATAMEWDVMTGRGVA